MVGLGFLEAKTTPFAPAGEGDVRLQNPLSEREDHLRRDLLTGLVHRLEYNFARGQRDVRLFELGTAFLESGGAAPTERIRVAAAWTGQRAPSHWTEQGEDWDLWDLKWLTAMLAETATERGAAAKPLNPPGDEVGLEEALAVVTPSGATLGWAGRLPREDIEAPRWAGDVWGLELEVVPSQPEPAVYRTLPVYPAIERDLALIVNKQRLAAEVGAVIWEAAPDFLEDLAVFDVYEGEKIPADTRSIAWRLRFRSPDRTLTDQEVDASVEAITSALERKLNVGVRGA
jgi:phenylalanyl-tRNA synthetase beta chain